LALFKGESHFSKGVIIGIDAKKEVSILIQQSFMTTVHLPERG